MVMMFQPKSGVELVVSARIRLLESESLELRWFPDEEQ
jgi:hypothetical protein